MQIVIDIPEEMYDWYDNGFPAEDDAEKLWQIVKNGTPLSEDMGEVSDGYHTFNQLYYQRAVLFATIVSLNKDKSWKSFKHFDGKYCFDSNGEWFIVGVDTPKGSYTYHYSKEYWNLFHCKELERGKEWDGHTEEDVTRLLSLVQEPCELPSAQLEIIRCGQCKYAEVADTKDSQDGYTCPYHRGSIWFSGSFCSWAERRTDKNEQ